MAKQLATFSRSAMQKVLAALGNLNEHDQEAFGDFLLSWRTQPVRRPAVEFKFASLLRDPAIEQQNAGDLQLADNELTDRIMAYFQVDPEQTVGHARVAGVTVAEQEGWEDHPFELQRGFWRITANLEFPLIRDCFAALTSAEDPADAQLEHWKDVFLRRDLATGFWETEQATDNHYHTYGFPATSNTNGPVDYDHTHVIPDGVAPAWPYNIVQLDFEQQPPGDDQNDWETVRTIRQGVLVELAPDIYTMPGSDLAGQPYSMQATPPATLARSVHVNIDRPGTKIRPRLRLAAELLRSPPNPVDILIDYHVARLDLDASTLTFEKVHGRPQYELGQQEGEG